MKFQNFDVESKIDVVCKLFMKQDIYRILSNCAPKVSAYSSLIKSLKREGNPLFILICMLGIPYSISKGGH